MAPTILQATALALRAVTTICPASPTCPQDNQCIYTYSGTSLQLSCATDYYGGDLLLAQTTTLAACLDACIKTDNCLAISYIGQNCYLKSTLNSAQTNNNVIGAAVTVRGPATPRTSADPVACPATYKCPENNGCTVQGSRAFVVSCGTDFYGGDYTNFGATNLETCAQTCANDVQCVAASFVSGDNAGQCYLKDKKNGANINNNVNAVAIDTRVVPSSPATPSTGPSAAPSESSPEVVPSSEISSVSSSTLSPPPTPLSSTLETSTAMPKPTNFCLRITTAGHPAFGSLIRAIGPNTNLFTGQLSGTNTYVTFFNLESTGRLVTTAGNIATPILPLYSVQVLRTIPQATINRAPNNYAPLFCSISASNELQCTGRGSQTTYTSFASYRSDSILRVTTLSQPPEGISFVNLGVFMGEQCE